MTTTWPTTSPPGAAASGPRSSAGSCSGTYALSAGYYDAFYVKAQKVRTLIKRDFDTPVGGGLRRARGAHVAQVALPFGARMDDPVQMYLSDACTLPVNMAGLPAICVPCGLSDGLPVGLQLIGAAWHEGSLFRLARGYEGVTAGRRVAARHAAGARASARTRPSASPDGARARPDVIGPARATDAGIRRGDGVH